jgi:hypothetical protein
MGVGGDAALAAEVSLPICGGVRIVVRLLAQTGADGVVMDVFAVGDEVVAVAHAAVGKSALPDGELGGEASGEAAFDELDGALKSDLLRREEKVDVVGHDDEGVELVMAFAA